MSNVNLSPEDHEFLQNRAETLGITVEELLESIIAKERLLSKPREVVDFPTEKPRTPIEPPHRKWGM